MSTFALVVALFGGVLFICGTLLTYDGFEGVESDEHDSPLLPIMEAGLGVLASIVGGVISLTSMYFRNGFLKGVVPTLLILIGLITILLIRWWVEFGGFTFKRTERPPVPNN